MAQPEPASDPAGPVVPAGVAEVIAVLNSTGVVVGSADQVLQATATLGPWGWSAQPYRRAAVLDLVRSVRGSPAW